MASARMMTKRRALGQHFLRDSTIAHAIVELVAPTERDLVVEVGPGDGALTGLLTGRAGRVLALEVDRALAATLRARFPAVEVLDADARTWDYTELAAPSGGRVLIVGNLPRPRRWTRRCCIYACCASRVFRSPTPAASKPWSAPPSPSAEKCWRTPSARGSACRSTSCAERRRPPASTRRGARKRSRSPNSRR
ncbi:MAG: hypothetical protein DME00_31930 [Candidatus Rokuibacteriota bacterium]|nr:MAG: hypothetical protein DME00_31930 [Candidatus Rokubacteria bacterium]